jgi:hypothetical protein
MPVEEGQALLGELIEFATQPQFVYRSCGACRATWCVASNGVERCMQRLSQITRSQTCHL